MWEENEATTGNTCNAGEMSRKVPTQSKQPLHGTMSQYFPQQAIFRKRFYTGGEFPLAF